MERDTPGRERSGEEPKARVRAEWDELCAVRVHQPGVETFVGILDPDPNLFLDEFTLGGARHEHRRLVEDLDDQLQGDDPVHYLHEDLDQGGRMDSLLSSRVSYVVEDDDFHRPDGLWSRLHDMNAYTQLQAIASNAGITRRAVDDDSQGMASSNSDRDYISRLTIDRPLSNLYFQRDQQLVTQRGVVMCSMKDRTRRPEVSIARAAWEALDEYDVDIVADMSQVEEHDVTKYVPEREDVQVTDVFVEGGDFVPAGSFSLLGVSAKISDGTAYPEYSIETDDTERVHRTTYAAGHKLLMENAFGAPEVGLVRAPFEAARESSADGEVDMDIMHLDTWFNLIDDDLAVAHEHLLDTEVDVYRATDGEEPYEPVRLDASFREYICDEHGFEVVDVAETVDPEDPRSDDALKVITNFMTLGPRKIMLVRFEDEADGVMARFVETMREEYDVEVVPDGTGQVIDNLRAGYGAIHCMTTPIRRDSRRTREGN